MANRTVRSLVSAVAAAASFALAPTAQAALYYQSDFDPFSFILKAIFEIDEDCLSPANTWVPNSTPCSVSMISAVATVNYDAPGPPTPDGTAYMTFVDITVPSSAVSSIIASVYVDSSLHPAGIEWTPFNLLSPPLSTIVTDPDSHLNGIWGLNLYNFSKLTDDGPPFDSTAILLQQGPCYPVIGCTWIPRDSAVVVSGTSTDPTGLIPLGSVRPLAVDLEGNAIRVAALVPEPSSIALLLGALGAGWLTRRRKPVA